MTRRTICLATLVIASFGSLPASADDQKITIAMHEPMTVRHTPDIRNVALNSTNLRAAIEIDETNPDDYFYRAHFQAQREEPQLALNDARKAVQLAPSDEYRDFRNDLEYRVSMRSFDVTEANHAAGLTDGFSRVAAYR